MNRAELIDAMADKADLSKAAAERCLNAMLEGISGAVAKGERVTLVGFGTFYPARRAARTGRNPRTGKEIRIAAATVPKFIAGAQFKAAVDRRSGR